MAVRVTLTLDNATAQRLNQTAARLAKTKSEVLCEAIREYHTKSDRLSESERLRMLRVMEEFLKEPPTRSQAEVDRELRELRASRRQGWRRASDVG
jgi:hypothetical protein